MHLPVGAEEIEYRSPPDGVSCGLPRQARKTIRIDLEHRHPSQDIGDIELYEVPAREDIRVTLLHVSGEPPEHRGLVREPDDPVPLVEGEIRNIALRHVGLPEERHVVVIERIPAGDAYDRVAFGLGEPLLIHALDIHDARPGRGFDIGRCELVILDRCSAAAAGRECDTGGKIAVDHEPGGERDIGFVVLLELIADGTDVAGPPGVEAPERDALYGAIDRILFNTLDLLWEGSPAQQIGRHIEIRPESGHVGLKGIPRGVAAEDVDDRGRGADVAVLDLVDADLDLPEVL